MSTSQLIFADENAEDASLVADKEEAEELRYALHHPDDLREAHSTVLQGTTVKTVTTSNLTPPDSRANSFGAAHVADALVHKPVSISREHTSQEATVHPATVYPAEPPPFVAPVFHSSTLAEHTGSSDDTVPHSSLPSYTQSISVVHTVSDDDTVPQSSLPSYTESTLTENIGLDNVVPISSLPSYTEATTTVTSTTVAEPEMPSFGDRSIPTVAEPDLSLLGDRSATVTEPELPLLGDRSLSTVAQPPTPSSAAPEMPLFESRSPSTVTQPPTPSSTVSFSTVPPPLKPLDTLEPVDTPTVHPRADFSDLRSTVVFSPVEHDYEAPPVVSVPTESTEPTVTAPEELLSDVRFSTVSNHIVSPAPVTPPPEMDASGVTPPSGPYSISVPVSAPAPETIDKEQEIVEAVLDARPLVDGSQQPVEEDQKSIKSHKSIGDKIVDKMEKAGNKVKKLIGLGNDDKEHELNAEKRNSSPEVIVNAEDYKLQKIPPRTVTAGTTEIRTPTVTADAAVLRTPTVTAEATVLMTPTVTVGAAELTETEIAGKPSVYGIQEERKGSGKVDIMVDKMEKAVYRGKQLIGSKFSNGHEKEKAESGAQCQLIDEDTIQSARDRELRKKGVDSWDPFCVYSTARRCRSLPFFKHRMYCLGILIALTIIAPGFLAGLLWGLYITVIGFVYLFVSDPNPKCEEENAYEKLQREMKSEANTIVQTMGLGNAIVYKGWMNQLRSRYHPASYHVNNTESVMVSLEGSTLRICRPAKSVLKHAFHIDPTLTEPTPPMEEQTIYDMTHAEVYLVPHRVAPRRWWVRKYPIQIRFPSRAAVLHEVNKERGTIKRSNSMNLKDATPAATVEFAASNPKEIPSTASEIIRLTPTTSDDEGDSDYEGYEAEMDGEESGDDISLQRCNSADDLTEFDPESKGKSTKDRTFSLYLFVRAAREKERWFHLFREVASKARADGSIYEDHDDDNVKGAEKQDTLKDGKSIVDNVQSHVHKPKPEQEFMLYQMNHMQFANELLNIAGCSMTSPPPGSTVSIDLGNTKWQPEAAESNSQLVSSVHAIFARVFHDFRRDNFWKKMITERIQAKIGCVHLPYFVEPLRLTSFHLGTATPSITKVYPPKMDQWGLWVDFEIKFHGSVKLILETGANLMKLQSGEKKVQTANEVSRWTNSIRVTHAANQDIPESPESSADEDFGGTNRGDEILKSKTGKTLLSAVEKVAQSKIFKKAAKLTGVNKIMEEISEEPFLLNVEITEMEGTLTVNIPPPPSDRLWYGFREPPKLSLRAVPQLGDRSVDMTTISDFVESKLRLLIEKFLVCPNMDDIVMPAMSGNALLGMGYAYEKGPGKKAANTDPDPR